MGYGMHHGFGLWGVNHALVTLLLLGIVIIVYLLAWKLYKEVGTKKK